MWIKTVNASIASRPCACDPLSQCYNRSIERTLAHIYIFIDFIKHTIQVMVSPRSKFWRRCWGREWFWSHVFVKIFFSVLVCRKIFTEFLHCRILLLLSCPCSRKQVPCFLNCAAETQEKPCKRGICVAFELHLLQGICKLHILIYSAVNFLLWLPTHCNKLKN